MTQSPSPKMTTLNLDFYNQQKENRTELATRMATDFLERWDKREHADHNHMCGMLCVRMNTKEMVQACAYELGLMLFSNMFGFDYTIKYNKREKHYEINWELMKYPEDKWRALTCA